MAQTGDTRIVAIIQARMSSHRLPRKVALDIHGACLLERVVRQVREAQAVDEIVVATSVSPEDEVVQLICQRLGTICFRGPLDDVRGRMIAAATEKRATHVIRVTADNPLTEPTFIDAIAARLRDDPEADYVAMRRDSIPDGSGAEGFRLQALIDTLTWDDSDYSREHVTPALRRGVNTVELAPPDEFAISGCFVGVDTLDHYLEINRIFARYGGGERILQRLIADLRGGKA